MFKQISRTWFFIFGGIFLLLLFSTLIFPVTYDDDFTHATAGNPFLLQWGQYLGNWHGRLISHIPLRIILQWGFPWTGAASSALALLFFNTAYRNINPHFLSSKEPKDFYLFIIFTLMLYAFIPVSCTAYGMTTFFMSNIFALTLILSFLIPYSAFLRGEDIQPKALPLFAFLAGASHEQAIAILPLLLILWGFFKWQKVSIPSWFYKGIAFFVLGSLIILLAPSTFQKERLLSYGGAENWEFMGQTLNWINLGWKRYFYSLLNWMLFTTNGAAWIPNAWPYFIIFGVLVYKARSNSKALFHALFYFIGAWGLIAIMMFSPLYYQASLIFGMVFLMTALMSLLSSLEIPPLPLKRLAILVSIAFFCIYTVQAMAWNHYRKEYNAVVSLINKAKAEGAPQVEVSAFTQFAISTPLGNVYPVFLQRTPTFYSRMAEYYQSPPIIVKQ